MDADTLVAELSDPRFDAAARRFTATITVITASTGPPGDALYDHFANVADAALARDFTGVSLFVNDESGIVADGCIVAPHMTCATALPADSS